MRVIKLLFGFLFIVFSSSFSYGQNWEWAKQATYINGSSGVQDYYISSDPERNIYETGGFIGGVIFGKDTLISTHRIYTPFMVKYDSAGNVKWAKQNGLESTTWESIGFSTATDKADNTYLCGDFGDTTTFGPYTLKTPTGHDIFLVKYDSAGNVLWAKCDSMKDGFDQSYCGQITLDNKGFIYVTGQFYDTVRFGSYTLSSSSAGIFVAKYDSSGNVIWAKSGYCPRGINVINSYVTNVQTDNVGNAYIAGDFQDTIIFSSDTLKTNSTFNVFLAKYDSAGNLLWIKTGLAPSNASTVYPQAETIDNANNIYVSGRFNDTLNFGSHRLISNGRFNQQAYIIKYDSAGNITWATISSGSSIDVYLSPYSMCTDKFDNIYLSGSFADTIRFGTVLLKSDSLQPGFLFQFDSSGKALCGTVLNLGFATRSSIAQIPDNSGIYFTTDLDSYPYCILGRDTVFHSHGSGVPFIAKWKPGNNSSLLITSSNSSDSICPSEPITLTATGLNNGATYLWSPGGATSSSITVSLVTTQVYTVTAIQGANTYKDSIKITVIPLPLPVISGRSLVCTGSRDTLYVSGGASYKWCNGSTHNSYITGLIQADSTFCVTAYNALGCSVSDTFKIDTTQCLTSIDEIHNSTTFEIMPNPSNGVFTMQATSEEVRGKSMVEIYNVFGQKVFSTFLPITIGINSPFSINLSPQPNGVYLYRVITEDGNLVGDGKLIIAK